MKGLDTNVLLRLLTGDDPAQSRRVREEFAGAEAAGEAFFLGIPVLCELLWTLRGSRYALDRHEQLRILEHLLVVPSIRLQERDAVRRAIDDFRRGRGDFADYLIGNLARSAGCDETLTFDRRLGGSSLFRVLD